MNAKCFIEISCLVIGTLIAFLGFALPLFNKWRNKPKLQINLDTKDPSLFTNFSFNNEFKENLSLKIEVENIGELQADDVQLTIQHVRVNNVPSSIPPMNLFWSYQDDRIRKNLELNTKARILGNSKQHCDFIFLIRQNFDTGVEFGYFVSENDQYLKIIDNGTYEIELSIGMLGSKAEKYIITFNLDKNKKEKTDIISNLHITQKC
ncbi:MAG: hypothetical protein IKL15_00035 [Mycoplasmataceae bacterium]|nr:hypothetical protein [Mycoplasmataceae bacterium]